MTNRTSNVWKFFTKDNDKTATCSLCQKKVKTSGKVSEFYCIIRNLMNTKFLLI